MNSTEVAMFHERKSCLSCNGGNLQELSTGRFDEGVVRQFIEEDPWGEHPAPFLKGQKWSYVACRDCGLAFHRYILSPEWNERRFSRWMSQEAIEAFEKSFKSPENDFRKAANNTAHALRIELLTRSLRGKAAPRVLDFGCGYGEFLSMCAMYGFEAYGVDRSSAKRDHGGFAGVFPEIEDVESRAPFHVLTLFEVLEHLDDPRQLLTRLSKLLAAGGILILETPDCSGVRTIANRDDYHKIHPLEHINGFTPQTLRAFAARLGFESIARPTSYVACDRKKLVKTAARQLLGPVLKPTTQQYFRKR